MYKIFNKNYNMIVDGDFNKVLVDLIGESEAIIGYDEHAKTANNQISKNTWVDIKKEEQVHFGELLALLYKLDPNFKTQVEKGMQEFNNNN